MVEIVSRLQPELEAFAPDVIYTHHPGDLNHDHRLTCRAVLVAERPMRADGRLLDIYAFETPSSTDQAPNTAPSPSCRTATSRSTRSSRTRCRHWRFTRTNSAIRRTRSRESIRALAIKRGAECGAHAAEAFMLLRSVVALRGVDAHDPGQVRRRAGLVGGTAAHPRVRGQRQLDHSLRAGAGRRRQLGPRRGGLLPRLRHGGRGGHRVFTSAAFT